MTESIKALEIKTYIIPNLDFANKTILLCLSFFFLFIDLYFLVPALIVHIFIPIAKLIIPIGIATKKQK